MVRIVLALVLLAASNAHAAILRGGERMRPEVVAKTLAMVEEEWRMEAVAFTEGKASTATGFAKSCATVVSAVVQGSGGDRDVAKEYMSKVCGQKVLVGWHKLRCTALASRITDHAMLADNYANRQNLSPAKVCTAFWSEFVEAEKNREAEEAKVAAELEKVRAEEAKKAAIVAAEAKKVADAKAKVEAELRAKEEARRAQEEKEQKAKRDADEAKARAAEAAARLAEKKVEAMKMQKEAQQKLDEAVKAEHEHDARVAEHKKAEEVLGNATKSAKPVIDAKPTSNTSEKVALAAHAAPKLAVKAPVAKKVVAVAAKPLAKATPAVVEKVAPKKAKTVAVVKPVVAAKPVVAKPAVASAPAK